MAHPKKSTKKFQRKVQKGTIKKHKRHNAGKGKRASDAEDTVEAVDTEKKELPAKKVQDLSIDEFLDGGFEMSDEEELEGEGDDDSLQGDEDDSDGDSPLDVPGDAGADSTDDEEEGEAGEENKHLKSEVSKHKRELDALKERDPEFYAYLKATDKELLDFEGSDSDDENDDEEDDAEGDGEEDGQNAGEEADDAEDEAPTPATKMDRVITTAVVEGWCKGAKQGSLRSIRFLLQAYRSACHYGDSDDPDDVKIASSKCYNHIMLFVLKEIDSILRSLLGLPPTVEDTPQTHEAAAKNAKWKKVQPLVKSYLGNSLHLLSTTTDPSLVCFIIRRTRASIPLIGACERLQKKYIKSVLGVFASSDSKPRIQAILFLRQAALHMPSPALDSILKGAHKAYTSNAKFVNAGSVPHIAFMASCITELFGLDSEASYVLAFGFIRQLAVTMRSALNTKTKDAFLEVYCWQYVNSLELWAKVLSSHSSNAELRHLVYPVAQLLMGAIRLVPTPRYFPLRLRLLRSLISLSKATGYFMPVAPLLLEILQWSELSRKPQAGGRLPNLQLQLRVSKNLLRLSVLQEDVVATVLELLATHLSQWSDHIAFPEVTNTTCVALRRFIKASAVERFRRSAKQVLDAIEKTAQQTRRRRDAVDFSPKDVGQVADFMETGEKSKQPNPLRRLSAELEEKGRQRRALTATEAVEAEESDGSEDESEAQSDGEEEETNGMMGDEEASEAEDEAEEEEEGGPRSGTALAAVDWSAVDESMEDELKAYELSDDDGEEEPSPGPSCGPAGKATKKAKHGGKHKASDRGAGGGGKRKWSSPSGKEADAFKKSKPGKAGKVGKGQQTDKGKGKGKAKR